MDILAQYQQVKNTLPSNVKLVAVSKFHPVEKIQAVYEGGQRIFGESRAQELCNKTSLLPSDIEWHFIGHLQTNKIKHVIPHVSLIHGVDTFHLLAEIDKESGKANKVTRCLLQMHIAQEETKFGLSEQELHNLLASDSFRQMKHVQVCGLMGMASNTDNMDKVRNEFRGLKQLFDKTKKQFFAENPSFCELSMGMSHDYTIAIEEGSTMVRIGTSIFGEREY